MMNVVLLVVIVVGKQLYLRGSLVRKREYIGGRWSRSGTRELAYSKDGKGH